VTIPNLLSLFRMGLVPLFIIALVGEQPVRALVIFLVAGVTDGLDGFIARFYGQQSHLGSYLDPIADKLLLTSAYVMLAITPQTGGLAIPVWVSILVIARDVLIVIVALILYVALDIAHFPPAMIGKVTTVVQVVTVVLVMLARVAVAFEAPAVAAIYLTVAFTLASGFFYILRASRMPEVAKGA
jgi:cardiolipin synthase (CMP-forming)